VVQDFFRQQHQKNGFHHPNPNDELGKGGGKDQM